MNNGIVKNKISRLIGRIEGDRPGPNIVALGGIHGNEPAGVTALEIVIDQLKAHEDLFKGKFLALRGNITALQHGVRYIDEDMNRIWYPSILDQIRQTSKDQLKTNERREIKELLKILDSFLPDNAEPTIFVDLHSFSAEGEMFAMTAPKESHLKLFGNLPVPLIFGIEKTLHGTTLNYYQNKEYITFGFEGGQHDSPETVDNNAAAMLAVLREAGCLSDFRYAMVKDEWEYLIHQHNLLPDKSELIYQYAIENENYFEMQPGYKNFQPVKKGEWLATDEDGKILAQCDGYILMPLYQDQGSDGFFIIREVEY